MAALAAVEPNGLEHLCAGRDDSEPEHQRVVMAKTVRDAMDGAVCKISPGIVRGHPSTVRAFTVIDFPRHNETLYSDGGRTGAYDRHEVI